MLSEGALFSEDTSNDFPWRLFTGCQVLCGLQAHILHLEVVTCAHSCGQASRKLENDRQRQWRIKRARGLVIEILFNLTILVASIYLIYLFFSKHYLFPKLYIGFLAVSLLFIPIDAWLLKQVFPGEPMFNSEITRAFIKTLILGTYMGFLSAYIEKSSSDIRRKYARQEKTIDSWKRRLFREGCLNTGSINHQTLPSCHHPTRLWPAQYRSAIPSQALASV